ncbi:NACHT domain-containing protein [Glycomyces xiaoerkulensis]|uniref:NACHT domain-containing protein n=1 Tax=Glycomyces xiaoerkulensis TaxID=2038139 RepID=UPI000DEEA013|nr:NACHT domain-containing protein [Glycomyces xiaoerkulensis]
METRAEQDAFKLLEAQIPEAARKCVLKRARVLHLPHTSGRGIASDLLAALMDHVVANDQGLQAVRVLADFFHRQAGEALGSSIDDWIDELHRTGLSVIAKHGGPAGMHAAARANAVGAYRDHLRADAGRIDLSLLAEDLPPIVDDNLVDGLRISGEYERLPDHLLPCLRRWRRMLLVGQPGSGKSVALREIAAHCVDHPHAPIPIRVSLPRLMEQVPEIWSIAKIIDTVAANAVTADQRTALAAFLLNEVGHGRALLLCDGLDECGARASWAAQQLSDVLNEIHPKTGFVLATRASAQTAAARLGLPTVELEPPEFLYATVCRVLGACAETRIPESERKQWLQTRRSWIRDARVEHSELLKVPLLAILLALVCASAADDDLPKGRAALLHRAVRESVNRWELDLRKLAPPRQWSAELSADMLLDGYIVLGRILDRGVNASQRDVLDALITMLRDPGQWAMPPARAREAASGVLRFWDEHVAVFVANGAGVLTARSKVFAEIATAMWTTTCSWEELTAWLIEALAYTDSDGAIALASGLNPRIMDALLDAGARGNRDATLMVAELATRDLGTLSPTAVARILEQLADGVHASLQGELPRERWPREPSDDFPMFEDRTRGPGPWPFVQAACMLPVCIDHRGRRNEALAAARLGREESQIAAALCELTDASADARLLTEQGTALVSSVLEQPVPADVPHLSEEGQIRIPLANAPIPDGLAEVALAAAARLGELADGVGERVKQIAVDAPRHIANRLNITLARAGIEILPWYAKLASMEGETTTIRRAEEMLLADLASLAEPDTNQDAGDLWSLSEVCDLAQATELAATGIHAVDRAFVHDSAQLRHAWLAAIADAYGIDKATVAAQARHLQRTDLAADQQCSSSDDWYVVFVESQEPPSPQANMDDALSARQKQLLLACLEADSSWMAWAAANVLSDLRNAPWNPQQFMAKDMSDWSRARAGLLYAVAILSAGADAESVLRQAVASEIADHRYAAWIAVASAPQLDPSSEVANAVRRDPDLSARPGDAWAEDPQPAYWSCRKCRFHNEIRDFRCRACDHATRQGERAHASRRRRHRDRTKE